MSTLIPEERHRHVLENCRDVPEEAPSFPIPVQKVGISGKTVWVSLAGNKGGHLPFTARIFVNLPADKRGIHMSRIEQAVSSLYNKSFHSLPEYGRLLAASILATQNAQHLSLELTGRMPHIHETHVSRLSSVDSVEISFLLLLAKNGAETVQTVQIGAGVHHLTACPCTLSYNELLLDRIGDPWPQPTHSQRSRTELLLSPPAFEQLPDYAALIGILHDVLHVSQDLLKRPDEAELVLKAHTCPQFAEDTVREVARAAGGKFRDTLPPETRVKVTSLSLESIHIHDVECSLDTTLGEIAAISHAQQKEQEPC